MKCTYEQLGFLLGKSEISKPLKFVTRLYIFYERKSFTEPNVYMDTW